MCCPPLICQSRYVLQLLPLFFVKALCQSLVPHRVTVLNCCSRKKMQAKGKCWIECSVTQSLLTAILIRIIFCYGYLIQDTWTLVQLLTSSLPKEVHSSISPCSESLMMASPFQRKKWFKHVLESLFGSFVQQGTLKLKCNLLAGKGNPVTYSEKWF